MIFTTLFSTSCGELGKHFSRGTDGNVSQNTESGQDLQLAAGSTSATLFEAHGGNSRVPEHTSSTTEDGLIRGPDFHAGSSSQYPCISVFFQQLKDVTSVCAPPPPSSSERLRRIQVSRLVRDVFTHTVCSGLSERRAHHPCPPCRTDAQHPNPQPRAPFLRVSDFRIFERARVPFIKVWM
ncbi:hypothetical protein FQA47_003822 [Oryzias melastigma]|uniref:Uncharacterized protein n=1 Tax=Oryzias melastigma TaxID=30732 RepID=A0A834FG14_ORYME|nr:hypothetical protein FQA47_003822 [Oryzias melastigma]